MTLNQIIEKIKTQAESHKMVGKFAVGAEFDFAVDEVKYYPLVWLVPNGFTFNTEQKAVNYDFSMHTISKVRFSGTFKLSFIFSCFRN